MGSSGQLRGRKKPKVLILIVSLAVSVGLLQRGARAGEQEHQPTSAHIVWAHGRVAPEGYAGDVVVQFSDGRHEAWTKHGGCELPKVSRTGIVGWTHGIAVHPTQGLMNSTLVVVRSGAIVNRIKVDNPFIDLWDFTDNDTCVVIRSRGPHGPSTLQKYRVATAKLLDSYSGSVGSPTIPAWARPYADR